MVNYNVGGIQVATARELEQSIKKYIPEVKITFANRDTNQLHSGIRVWDDTFARQELGWKPEFTTLESMVSDFIRELRAKPDRYRF